MLHFLIFYVGVNFNSILLAFERYDANFDLTFVGFENFATVFREFGQAGGALAVSTLNSVLVFVCMNAIGFPLNMFFGYYLFKKVRGSAAIRFFFFFSSIISGMIMGLVFSKILSGPLPQLLEMLGHEPVYLLSDPDLIIWTVIFYSLWTGFSSSLILYPNAMNAIAPEVLESAQLDGANSMQELWRIIVPLIFPTVTTFFVMSVAGIFSFTGPLLTFYEYNAPTQSWTTGYYFLRAVLGPGTSVIGYPKAAAAGIVLTVVSAPLTLFTKWAFEKFGPSEEK